MTDWSRHESLAGLGASGQRKLGEASVLVVGLGGLGSPVARYLAAAGIGRLTLCDFDTISASDLHRQILYGPHDVGEAKASTAAPRLSDTHPECVVTVLERPFDASDASGHAIIVDCTDEPGSRALIHAAALAAGIPLVWGTVEGWDGQVTTIIPGGPCIDCLFPEGREVRGCAEIGVFGPLAGTVGTMMAAEAAKTIAGLPNLCGQLLVIDGLEHRFDRIGYELRPGCACAAEPK